MKGKKRAPGEYRRLQRHLDGQALGFPAARSGADLRFLKRMFGPDEARLALHLSFRPATLPRIMRTAGEEFTESRAAELLESMLAKGSIGSRDTGEGESWFLLPMVVGMFEAQDGRPSKEFLRDAMAYMGTKAYGKSLLAAQPSQMRTIPIGESIAAEHSVATWDRVSEIIGRASPPFVILPCICRETSAMRGSSCRVTSRTETCLAMGSMAATILKRGSGREIGRSEALSIIAENQKDGLVLQPANAREPEFICSCCGCCCGMLRIQKMLPHPIDFWTAGHLARVDAEKCTGCGACVRKCQVDAVLLKGSPPRAVVAGTRCIGCGLCVTACPVDAVRLESREDAPTPPQNYDDLYETIAANRKGPLRQLTMLLKVLLRMRQ